MIFSMIIMFIIVIILIIIIVIIVIIPQLLLFQAPVGGFGPKSEEMNPSALPDLTIHQEP